MISIMSRPDESRLKSQVPMVIRTPLPLPREAPGPKIQIDAEREKKKLDLILNLGSIDFDFLDPGRQSKDEVFLNGIPREVVITFVETIEKAYHYFYFKDYLRLNIQEHCSRPDLDNILDTLSRTQGLESVFHKLDKIDVSYILERHISKLKQQHEAYLVHKYVAYLEKCKFITTESKLAEDLKQILSLDEFSSLSYDKRVKFLKEYKAHIIFRPDVAFLTTTLGLSASPCEASVGVRFSPSLPLINQEEPDEAFINPIYKMVFDSLKGVSTLDLNPGVELERIKRSHPSFYDNCLVYRIPPLRCSFVPSMAVFVTNLPFNVNKKDVEEFFSDCGDATVKIRSRNDPSEPGAACVTFRTTDGQEKALLKQDKKFENGIIQITAVPGRGKPIKTVQTREIGAAEDVICVLTELEDNRKLDEPGSRNLELLILHKVLEKYWLYSEKRLTPNH